MRSTYAYTLKVLPKIKFELFSVQMKVRQFEVHQLQKFSSGITQCLGVEGTSKHFIMCLSRMTNLSVSEIVNLKMVCANTETQQLCWQS